MQKGDAIFYVDTAKGGSEWDPSLPKSYHKGRIEGVGNSLISVRVFSGYICFDLQTRLTRDGLFKLMESEDAARAVINNRNERLAAAHGAGAQVVHVRRKR